MDYLFSVRKSAVSDKFYSRVFFSYEVHFDFLKSVFRDEPEAEVDRKRDLITFLMIILISTPCSVSFFSSTMPSVPFALSTLFPLITRLASSWL